MFYDLFEFTTLSEGCQGLQDAQFYLYSSISQISDSTYTDSSILGNTMLSLY